MEIKELLERAQKFYTEGKWLEAITLLKGGNIEQSATAQDITEVCRIRGWSYYYLGIKGPEKKKRVHLKEAVSNFRLVLARRGEQKAKISAFNGLPLALWILGRKNESWRVSNKAVKEFPNTPSIWNTRSILCRWAKNYGEAVEASQKVFETALKKGDYKTAGHGKHNKADALVKLGRIDVAKKEYGNAVTCYVCHSKHTGESTQFHIEGVIKKVSELSTH